MTARADARALFERKPASVLEMDLDYCTHSYGSSPCTAGRRIAPALDLDLQGESPSLAPVTGTATFTVTRAGATATRVNASGLIETVAANAPRFDYDPVTLACKGLLIEEARTNLCVKSEDLNTATIANSGAVGSWTRCGDPGFPADATTIVADAATSPMGTASMDKVVEGNGALNPHGVRQSFNVTAGQTYYLSWFAKAAERTRMSQWSFSAAINGDTTSAIFDLATGAVVSGSDSPGIEDYGNGIYRCVRRIDIIGTGRLTIHLGPQDGTAIQMYNGDGASGVYIWGVQLELGPSRTSYIPTTSAAVTRNADVVTCASISGFYNASEGTILVEVEQATFAQTNAIASFNDGTSAERISMRTVVTSGDAFLRVSDGAVDQAGVDSAAACQLNGVSIAAAAYAANDFALSLDGTAIQTDTAGTLPTPTALALGSEAGAAFLNAHLRRFAYFNSRLSNADLVALSGSGLINFDAGCYNTFTTCQDTAHYNKGVKTIKFSSRGMFAPAGELVRPYIASSSFTPTQIDATKGLAARSQTAVTMADEPCRDDLDKYVDSRTSPAGGTFWPRLIARNPNAIGRFARMRKGFVVDPWDWATFQDELYVIEQIAGPDAQGQVKVVLSDAIKLLDRIQLPAATDGKLSADVKAISDSGTIQSATSTTAVLPSSASAVDDAYTGQELHITGGLGLDQRRVITGYVGLTRTATVAAWTTTPDSTSLYEVVPLSIDVGSGKGAQYNDPTVTLANEYVRIGDEVIRYTAIAGDVLSWPDGTYRAQFGTTSADHKANDGVQQCLAWIAANASDVVHDIINLGGVADAYIDLATLATIEADWFGTKAAITACIVTPETGSSLLADLLKDLNMMVWWDPVAQLVRFKSNMPELGSATATLTDDNFIRGTTSAQRLDTERLTRASLAYDLLAATADTKKDTNYRTIDIFVDTDAESANGYGDQRPDARYSRWLGADNSVFASAVVQRRLLTKRDAPVAIKTSLDPKDEVSLGDLVNVQTRRAVGADGNPATVLHRIVKVTDKGGRQDIETRSTTFGRRYAFICPNGYPDYSSASDAQRQTAFIAGASGLMSDGSSAYLIL